MTNYPLEIYAQRLVSQAGLGIWIYTKPDPFGKVLRAKPLEFEDHTVGQYEAPTIFLGSYDGAAQALMNEMWQTGVRPTRELVAPQTDTALSAHLQDMRALVSKAYELELPK